MPSVTEFERRMNSEGWFVFPDVVPAASVDRMNLELEVAWESCRDIQSRNGVASDADLTVHHLIVLGQSFITLLEEMEVLNPYFETYFGGRYIVNSLGGSINRRSHGSYLHRIHRDIRSFSGDLPLLLNTLVMLDDFTLDNGATYLGAGTHKTAAKINETEFYAAAARAVGTAGSVLVFNSNVWHAAGHNQTDRPRRSVTPMFCRPFIKPQFDYPRALGYDRKDWSPHLRQLLGYNSRIPASLEEWYQPPQQRMYLSDQG